MREQAATAGPPGPESLPTPLNGSLAVWVSLLSFRNLVGWVPARLGQIQPALTEEYQCTSSHRAAHWGLKLQGRLVTAQKMSAACPAQMLLKRKLMHVLIKDDKADFTQGGGEP